VDDAVSLQEAAGLEIVTDGKCGGHGAGHDGSRPSLPARHSVPIRPLIVRVEEASIAPITTCGWSAGHT